MADDRTYVRIHDGLDDHPKVVGLSDSAYRLLTRAWFYCSRQLTDGRLPDAAWKDRGSPKARRELIDAGLAHLPGYVCAHADCPTPPPRHVQMHDYLEHQRSAAEVAELKRRRAEAGRKGGRSRAHGQASAKQVLEQVLKQTASKVEASTETETDTEEEPPLGGVPHVSRGAPADPPLYSDRCQRHANVLEPGNCGACADVRKANRRLAVVGQHNPARVPHCGKCDETRHIETPVGVIRCPRCHPRAEESA